MISVWILGRARHFSLQQTWTSDVGISKVYKSVIADQLSPTTPKVINVSSNCPMSLYNDEKQPLFRPVYTLNEPQNIFSSINLTTTFLNPSAHSVLNSMEWHMSQPVIVAGIFRWASQLHCGSKTFHNYFLDKQAWFKWNIQCHEWIHGSYVLSP